MRCQNEITTAIHERTEGWAAGLVPDPVGFMHELRRPDVPTAGITTVQAACECGWRSERFSVSASLGLEWDGVLFAPAHVRDRAERLWAEHIAVALYRRRVSLGYEAGSAPVLVDTLRGLERCQCGHLRNQHKDDGGCSGLTFDTLPGVTVRTSCGCRGYRFTATPA